MLLRAEGVGRARHQLARGDVQVGSALGARLRSASRRSPARQRRTGTTAPRRTGGCSACRRIGRALAARGPASGGAAIERAAACPPGATKPLTSPPCQRDCWVCATSRARLRPRRRRRARNGRHAPSPLSPVALCAGDRADAEHAVAIERLLAVERALAARAASRGHGTSEDIAAPALARDQRFLLVLRASCQKPSAIIAATAASDEQRREDRASGRHHFLAGPRRRVADIRRRAARPCRRAGPRPPRGGQRHPQQRRGPRTAAAGELQPQRQADDQRADDQGQERSRPVADVEACESRARRRGSAARTGPRRRTASARRSGGTDRKGQPKRCPAAPSMCSGAFGRRIGINGSARPSRPRRRPRRTGTARPRRRSASTRPPLRSRSAGAG